MSQTILRAGATAWVLLFALLCTAALSGCGQKTPPPPATPVQPVAPTPDKEMPGGGPPKGP